MPQKYGGPTPEGTANFGRYMRKQDLRGKSPAQASKYLDEETKQDARDKATHANAQYARPLVRRRRSTRK